MISSQSAQPAAPSRITARTEVGGEKSKQGGEKMFAAPYLSLKPFSLVPSSPTLGSFMGPPSQSADGSIFPLPWWAANTVARVHCSLSPSLYLDRLLSKAMSGIHKRHCRPIFYKCFLLCTLHSVCVCFSIKCFAQVPECTSVSCSS